VKQDLLYPCFRIYQDPCHPSGSRDTNPDKEFAFALHDVLGARIRTFGLEKANLDRFAVLPPRKPPVVAFRGSTRTARRQLVETKQPPESSGCEDHRGLVEAAGVEPASGSAAGEATPCSASSVVSPRRLEKRQNGGEATPDLFRGLVRGSELATPAFRDVGRGAAGALPGKRGYLIKQPERSCCCSQLLFSTFFYEDRGTSACNLSRNRPRRSRFAPTVPSARDSKIGAES
jgi:hypothetical protein